jgi:excisionase family DNA binding protein
MGEPKFEYLVDTAFLGERLGVSKAYLEDARKNLGLPFYKIGKNIRFRLSEVEKWLKERKVNG